LSALHEIFGDPAATSAAAELMTTISRPGTQFTRKYAPHNCGILRWRAAADTFNGRACNAEVFWRYYVALDFPCAYFRDERFAGQRNFVQPARTVDYECRSLQV